MKKESFAGEFFSTGFTLLVYIGIPLAIIYALHLFMGLPFVILSTLISVTVTYFFGYLTSLMIYKVLNIDIESIAKKKMKDKFPRGGPGGSSSDDKEEETDKIDINNLPPVDEEEEEEYSAGISEDAKDKTKDD